MNDDKYATFDGAYLIGSLSPADTAQFEGHLETCDECMHRVADLRNLPTLLALAPPNAFTEAAAADGHPRLAATRTDGPASYSGLDAADVATFPDELLPHLQAAIRTDRRRWSRTNRIAIGVAAACVLALASIVANGQSGQHTANPLAAAATVHVSNPVLAADLRITNHDSWDQVNLNCTYKSATYVPGNYQAIAADDAGDTEVVGTWPAIPGQTAAIHTPTTFHTGKITRVTIINTAGKTIAQLQV